jgi:hypothetical protein
VVRHRLSRAVDRKLNHALYMMAIVQVGRPSAERAYYRRKRVEGKSPTEALRCLKRRLSDTYRCLLADQRAVALGGRHRLITWVWFGRIRPCATPAYRSADRLTS